MSRNLMIAAGIAVLSLTTTAFAGQSYGTIVPFQATYGSIDVLPANVAGSSGRQPYLSGQTGKEVFDYYRQTGPLPSLAGAGQSPAEAREDNRPNYDRAPVYAHPEADPDKAGNAGSDGSAGLNSLQSPEPKADGGG